MLRVALAWATATLGMALATMATAQEAKRVLLLHPNQTALVASQILDAALRDEMRAGGGEGVEVFSEYLDTARFPDAAHEERMAGFIGAKYAGRRPDLVIAAGDPALAFALRHRASLFDGIPLIFTAIAEGNPRLNALPPDVVGLVSRFDVAPTVELALRLQPEARRVVLVAGAAPLDRAWEQAAHVSLQPYAGRLEITSLAGLPMDELLREVARIPRDAIVLMLPINRDGAGRSFPVDIARGRAAAASSAPVYSPYDTMIGRGAVGGYMDTFDNLARETARLGLRILGGERPAMPVARDPGAFRHRIDWREFRRWKLDEARLPAETVIHFREASLWERYRWQIVAVILVFIAQSALIAVLVVQRRRRLRAELEAAEQRRELTHLSRVATLGELSGAMAHELNQPLTAILSNAQAAQRLLARPAPDLAEIRDILADIVTEDRRAGEVIRHLRMLLRKDDARIEALDLNDIVSDTIQLLHSDLVARGVGVSARLADDLPPVLGDRVQLQQVLLNLIGNACDAMEERPAAERQLIVATGADAAGAASFSVVDDGQGITAEIAKRLFQPFVTSKAKGLGLGLSICRSIVEAHGGRLTGSNNADRGATFSVALPTGVGPAR